MKKLVYTLIFVLALFSCSPKRQSMQFTIGIKSDFAKISDAIKSNLILNGDILLLNDEIYNEGNLYISKSIKIVSKNVAQLLIMKVLLK